MRARFLATAVVCITIIVVALHGAPPTLGANPVIVELFTSQG